MARNFTAFRRKTHKGKPHARDGLAKIQMRACQPKNLPRENPGGLSAHKKRAKTEARRRGLVPELYVTEWFFQVFARSFLGVSFERLGD
jgi:hypothetical protein